MQVLGQSPEMQFVDSVHSVSEAVVILQDCGGGMRLVDALMSQAMLMYKDPSASGDPRPMLENIKSIIVAAEVEAECVFTLSMQWITVPTDHIAACREIVCCCEECEGKLPFEIAEKQKRHWSSTTGTPQ